MIILILKRLIQTCYNQTKKTYKNLDIYNIRYVTIKKIGYGYDINSVNPLYLRINYGNGYIEKKKMQINIQYSIQQMKIKNYFENILMFLMELEVKLEKLMMIGLNIQKTT